jgi:hypothetical protein
LPPAGRQNDVAQRRVRAGRDDAHDLGRGRRHQAAGLGVLGDGRQRRREPGLRRVPVDGESRRGRGVERDGAADDGLAQLGRVDAVLQVLGPPGQRAERPAVDGGGDGLAVADVGDVVSPGRNHPWSSRV